MACASLCTAQSTLADRSSHTNTHKRAFAHSYGRKHRAAKANINRTLFFPFLLLSLSQFCYEFFSLLLLPRFIPRLHRRPTTMLCASNFAARVKTRETSIPCSFLLLCHNHYYYHHEFARDSNFIRKTLARLSLAHTHTHSTHPRLAVSCAR